MTEAEVKTHKSCNECGLRKPITEFHKGKSPDGYRAKCKTCCRAKYHDPVRALEANRRYRESNPEAHLRSQRDSWLRRNYGITGAAYEQMVVEQGGVCAICSVTEPGGKRQFWCVDHNHETGDVRGLLCARCNAGLGQFKDDKELLMSAVAYLLVHDGDDD